MTAKPLDEYVEDLVQTSVDGKFLIGPVVLHPDGTDETYFFVLWKDSESWQSMRTRSNEEGRANFVAVLLTSGNGGLAVHQFDDEVRMMEMAVTLWNDDTLRETLKLMQEDRAREVSNG